MILVFKESTEDDQEIGSNIIPGSWAIGWGEMGLSCDREGLDWILRNMPLLKEWWGFGTGCLGRW